MYQVFTMSPDGSTIVYVARQGGDPSFNLYKVAINGGTPIRLNPPRSFPNKYLWFTITPDSRYVIFASDQEIPNVSELYGVPLVGGATTKLSLPIPADRRLMVFWVAPDSKYVVYATGYDDPKRAEWVLTSMVSASLEGGGYASFKETLASGDILDFQFTPNGEYILYRADSDGDRSFEVYAIPVQPLFTTASIKPLRPRSYLPILVR
jgi:Tol biopolymer transport system component